MFSVYSGKRTFSLFLREVKCERHFEMLTDRISTIWIIFRKALAIAPTSRTSPCWRGNAEGCRDSAKNVKC